MVVGEAALAREAGRNPTDKYAVAATRRAAVQPGRLAVRVHREIEAGRRAGGNWLPVGSGRFNIMLRAYGPEGVVAANTYVPPAIQKR